MDDLRRYVSQVRQHLVWIVLANNVIIAGLAFVLVKETPLKPGWVILIVAIVAFALTAVIGWFSTLYVVSPMQSLWKIIEKLAPGTVSQEAPPPTAGNLGHDLVVNLTGQLYQLANNIQQMEKKFNLESHDLQGNWIATYLPLPLITANQALEITYINSSTCQYLQKDSKDLIGKVLYDVLDMSFPTDQTFEVWLNHVKDETVSAEKTWEQVRVDLGEQVVKQCDLAAYYSKGEANGHEILLVLFDHTDRYNHDDQDVSFVALAAHELRTPLTLMRGYVEALGDELKDKMTPKTQEFLRKSIAAGQQLSTFINNILNVSRIDDNQFIVELQEIDWLELVRSTVKDMQLRAGVRGITITEQLPASIPTVAADPVAMYEVLCNLLDNAIKYHGKDTNITVNVHIADDKKIETDIIDHGIGIPGSVIPHLFDKFYRSHRTREHIDGTGLGLYLCNAVVSAHSGNIWVNSKEGQGSTFSFTLLPFSDLPPSTNPKRDQVRIPHGWIKNHSFYRR